MPVIDLRSDTVTLPTPAMKKAMADAELGDDVYGEDPTVNRLQELTADMLGKEAGLFVASGTMGNLISLIVHAPRGSEVIAGDESHIYHYEQGGASTLGSLVFHPVHTENSGELSLANLKTAIRNRNDDHSALPGVICLENTHNRKGGVVLKQEYVKSIRTFADQESLPLHLDGARLANAAVYLNTSMRELAEPFDSIQLDLSKGLCAPVGGVIAGSKEFIRNAKRIRKMLGGGMRQAGVIAAAGLVSLTEMVDRLAEDHANARLLAEALNDLPEIQIDVNSVQTNLVRCRLISDTLTDEDFIQGMKAQNILLGRIGNGNLRFVTHYGITKADIQTTVQSIQKVLSQTALIKT
jgi:threonine aldolase